MRYYMKDYIKEIDEFISKGDKKMVNSVIDNHLIKIKFFMHERLIHLMVTILFSLMTLLTFFYCLLYINVGIILLFLLFLGLLVPYVFHYYHLENGVQYMYKQYDKLLELKNK